jgi:NAD(P)H-hydrate epimerase
MLIISAAQARAWDQYTIASEPIHSIELMERAAQACVDWIENNLGGHKKKFSIFCGKGNNGGDGLAIARMLCPHHDVEVFILEFGHLGTEDFQVNLSRLHALPNVEIRFIQEGKPLPELDEDTYILDALFGTGLNRALEGITAELVNHTNTSGCPVIAIDMPSGLSADQSSLGTPVIHAHHTLSFQAYKKAFLMAENAEAFGQVHILDIGLHPVFEQELKLADHWIDLSLVRSIYRPRPVFSHKGNFGHALLLAGSHGKMGAAILSARAALAGGTGLLTCHVPSCGYGIMQTAVPEAMVSVCEGDEILNVPADLDVYETIGVGPGIGTGAGAQVMLDTLLQQFKRPLVIDADALNILANEPSLQARLPTNSILTPHPKEFDRIAGDSKNDFERVDSVVRLAAKLDCIIVLKGHHSLVCMPGGQRYWNSSGNPGMAKGGSGDVLTGLLTGLLASGYSPEQAALLGVFLHGKAGDLAAESHSPESMTASDIIAEFGHGFQIISHPAS